MPTLPTHASPGACRAAFAVPPHRPRLAGQRPQPVQQPGRHLPGRQQRAGRRQLSQGLQGRYSVAQGLARLLQGSGLQAVAQGNAGYVLQPLAEGNALQLDATAINAATLLVSNGQSGTGYRGSPAARPARPAAPWPIAHALSRW